MKFSTRKLVLLLLLSIVLFQGCLAEDKGKSDAKSDAGDAKPAAGKSVPYDYTASVECVKEPPKPLYGGGIIGGATGAPTAPGGKRLLADTKGSCPVKGKALKFDVKKDHHYALSAWLQLSKGTGDIKANLVFDGKFTTAAIIAAQSGCWTMLKGGATSFADGKGELFFETVNATAAEIMSASIAVQGFSFAEWASHRNESVHKERMQKMKLTVNGGDGKPLAGAELSLERVGKGFPVGNAMTKEILDLPAYEKWFTSRFKVATMENEMKWISTEFDQNRESYAIADKMLALAQKYNISVRGHNVLWDDPTKNRKWVLDLGEKELKAAVDKRVKSVATHFAGKVIHWDVNNENLHFSYFEDKLGKDLTAQVYSQVAKLDPKPLLFMNEFNTLEQPGDLPVVPTKYIAKLKQIQSYPGNSGLKYGIGLESHFASLNVPYVRGSLDMFMATKLPIWLTEVDVAKGPKQVEYLEEVMREGFAHPGVKGLVLWGAWHANGCYAMCLTDNSFKNLPQGDVVDKLIAEWSAVPKDAKTDDKGVFETELYHGEYKVTVKHKSLKAPVEQTVDLDTAAEATIKAGGK